jgi:hypothetical protein
MEPHRTEPDRGPHCTHPKQRSLSNFNQLERTLPLAVVGNVAHTAAHALTRQRGHRRTRSRSAFRIRNGSDEKKLARCCSEPQAPSYINVSLQQSLETSSSRRQRRVLDLVCSAASAVASALRVCNLFACFCLSLCLVSSCSFLRLPLRLLFAFASKSAFFA